MKNSWTTTKLVATGSFAVLSVVLQLFGSGITLITGIPLASALLNIFIAPALIVLNLMVLNQSGSVSIMYFIMSFLLLPLPLNGAPGFLPKIPILIGEGLLADILYRYVKGSRRLASAIIGMLTMLYAGIITIEVCRYLDIPGIEKTAEVVYSPLVIVFLIFSGLSGYLGYLIYEKIKDTAAIRRIQT